jgi:recombination protein RecR
MSKRNESVPREINALAEQLATLPGIGPKQAFRLAIYLSAKGKSAATKLVSATQNILQVISTCELCGNLSVEASCQICQDSTRNEAKLMVLESVVDLVQIDGQTDFDGYYVVLGGLISPLNGTFAENINAHLLLKSIETRRVEEVIFALPTTVEGEATAAYLTTLLANNPSLKLTRVARGLPTGASLEYADPATLSSAINSRIAY